MIKPVVNLLRRNKSKPAVNFPASGLCRMRTKRVKLQFCRIRNHHPSSCERRIRRFTCPCHRIYYNTSLEKIHYFFKRLLKFIRKSTSKDSVYPFFRRFISLSSCRTRSLMPSHSSWASSAALLSAQMRTAHAGADGAIVTQPPSM